MSARALLAPLLGVAFLVAATVPVFAQVDPFAAAAKAEAEEAAARTCQDEFGKLRTAVEKRGVAIKTANDRKAPPKDACRLFRNFVESEANLVKFFVEKKTTCRIPDAVLAQSKEAHTKAIQIRNQVCQAAETGAPQAPPPPSMGLSGALGTTSGGTIPDAPGSSGVFDTLTGNVLRR